MRPCLIVLHYTAMDSADAALDRLCDPQFEVSAHYLIGQQGQLWQMVDENDRAWHAGRGAWAGCTDVNSASIGIELCNDGQSPFPIDQMDRLAALLRDIQSRHGLTDRAVIGHSDMAPDRKQDPGRLFDWTMLGDAGLAIAGPPRDAAAVRLPFLEAARRFGYSTDVDADAILEAFRQRFRPDASGPLTDADIDLMSALAAAYPIDQTQVTV